MAKTILRISTWLLAIIIVFILFSNVWIIGSTRNQVYSTFDLKLAPTTIMLLGTSHRTKDGGDNPFFHERIKTVNSLYQTGHIHRIVLSGDHETQYYNEPQAMRTALLESGVPDSIMVSDGGGVRTLDSVVRCKRVLNIDNVIIVTQKFHAYRALFISQFYNLKAIVVVTEPVESPKYMVVLMREVFARPLAVIDLYLLHRQPDIEEDIIN